MAKYEVFGNYNLHAKSFLFVTSQMVDDENISEYFYVINERNGDIKAKGRSLKRTKDVIEFECEDLDVVEYCFHHAKEMGENAIALYFMDKYFNDHNGEDGPINKKYEFAFDMSFKKVDLMSVVRFTPKDEKIFHFMYQSVNEELKNYLEVLSKMKRKEHQIISEY